MALIWRLNNKVYQGNYEVEVVESRKSEGRWGTDHQCAGRDQHRALQCWSHWSHSHFSASSGWLCKTWIIPSTLQLISMGKKRCSAGCNNRLPRWDSLRCKAQAYVWALLSELRGSARSWILGRPRCRNPARGSRCGIPAAARSRSPPWGAGKHPRGEQIHEDVHGTRHPSPGAVALCPGENKH